MSDVKKFRIYPYYKGSNKGVTISNMVDEMVLDENGIPKVVGQFDAQELIQQFAEEVDINNIIAQHLATDTMDELAVHAEDNEIVDVSGFASDINTLNAKVNDLRRLYQSLNPEQLALFTGFEDFINNTEKLYKKNDEKIEVNNNES